MGARQKFDKLQFVVVGQLSLWGSEKRQEIVHPKMQAHPMTTRFRGYAGDKLKFVGQ